MQTAGEKRRKKKREEIFQSITGVLLGRRAGLTKKKNGERNT